MKMKTVVDLTESEVRDALIEKARTIHKQTGGSVTVEIVKPENGSSTPTARVSFEHLATLPK